MQFIIKIPTMLEIKEAIPLTVWQIEQVLRYRKMIWDIVNWRSDMLLLIVWPCSIDFKEPVLEYAKRLKQISDKVEDKIMIVMRTYTCKPRTSIWWKWILYNWEFWSGWNILDGINTSRYLIRDILKIWLPVADEMLYPDLVPFFDDIICYYAIWARSSENQAHREVASWLDIPVWIKNTTSGDMKVTANSLIAVRSSSQVLLRSKFYKTGWNQDSHIILRWSNYEGKSKSNINQDIVDSLIKYVKDANLMTKLIIDLNHDNSGKDWLKQIESLKSAMKLKWNHIVWYMIESYLYGWNQKASEEKVNTIKKWLSITDSCLWIEKTEEMIMYIYKSLN